MKILLIKIPLMKIFADEDSSYGDSVGEDFVDEDSSMEISADEDFVGEDSADNYVVKANPHSSARGIEPHLV